MQGGKANLSCEKVDGHAFSAKSPAPPDAMDIILAVRGEVVIDNERHLLHVYAAREHICERHEHAMGECMPGRWSCFNKRFTIIFLSPYNMIADL